VAYLNEVEEKRPRRQRIVRVPGRRPTSEDLEFSDYGRDPHFSPGWWLVPFAVIAMVLSIWLLS
jgi:hypothetical protein